MLAGTGNQQPLCASGWPVCTVAAVELAGEARNRGTALLSVGLAALVGAACCHCPTHVRGASMHSQLDCSSKVRAHQLGLNVVILIKSFGSIEHSRCYGPFAGVTCGNVCVVGSEHVRG